MRARAHPVLYIHGAGADAAPAPVLPHADACDASGRAGPIRPRVCHVVGLGARRGKGVLVVRQYDGSWSNPSFITLTGGSFGFRIGAQSTDVILVFKTRKGVDGIANGKFTLGADASVAAGPVGRSTAVSTDFRVPG